MEQSSNLVQNLSASQIASQAMLELNQVNQANDLAQKLGQDLKPSVSNVSNVRISSPKTQQSPPQQQFQPQAPQAGAPHHVQQTSGQQPHLPPQGSDEWHRQRRENHKEVERRRRETINEGISELQKIVPGCEKNKGSILARSVQYIQQLKDNEAANIEKWTLEKLLTDQAINELSQQVDMLKSENERLRADTERLRTAQGVSAPPEADPVPPAGKRKRTDVEAGANKNG